MCSVRNSDQLICYEEEDSGVSGETKQIKLYFSKKMKTLKTKGKLAFTCDPNKISFMSTYYLN